MSQHSRTSQGKGELPAFHWPKLLHPNPKSPPPPNILYASVAQNNMCYDTGSFCVLLKCIGEDHSHLAGKEEGWGEYICSENFHQLSNKYDMNFFLKKKTFLGISLHLPLIAYYH